MRADLITVYHRAKNHQQHLDLFDAVRAAEPAGGFRLVGVDNRVHNRGFAAACNLGAFHPRCTAPVIGFLNPDLIVQGPFLDAVSATLRDDTVITGCRFGKPQRELDIWGVTDWVCGAALFVQRRFFSSVGGFDEQFEWSWEETDLIRQAQARDLRCRSIPLPMQHTSPPMDDDANYKHHHYELSARRYYKKWSGH